MMVLVNPMVTTCSHLVCSPCMSQWVAKQRVNAQKQKKALDKVPPAACTGEGRGSGDIEVQRPRSAVESPAIAAGADTEGW